ncbi:Receptor-interacting serine/threonine-protein kinase 1 [Apiospora aurea]|uniref:Receptor-interacting serine/threonine-protein kinase 1 n=1 Tax=Apiospora aurea TaxID=335848 RepID=A0ABR1QJE6_9PEZI
MATQADLPSHESPPADSKRFSGIFKKLMSWKHSTPPSPELAAQEADEKDEKVSRPASPTKDLMRRVSRRVVPGLPRAKTFKRQQSEGRDKLEPNAPTQAERRAVSVDRRANHPRSPSHASQQHQLPRASAPDFLDDTYSVTTAGQTLSVPHSPVGEKHFLDGGVSAVDIDHPEDRELLRPGTPLGIHSRDPSRDPSTAGARSTTTSLYEAQIHEELESKWILNLSMHFRDKSKREKFFVTFRQNDFLWRRVTISLDYRNAPDDSLEKDLLDTKFQREKSAKIYEAIRESLHDIQFYETVTNLKLQTTEGRLHVHVVEDVNEIIHYPTVRMIQHLRCKRIRERNLDFDSHMSGFVYKIRVGEKTLIKKEIPGPDTVDEFLYEVNALNALAFSSSVIKFYGVVVDDNDESVKGLLIDYASQGALIDLIYDSQEDGLVLSWAMRERWARQIVQGLADIHEAGFVQGDFTLSNIVIDDDRNAKIIDINRRGCPVGWEPPEATPLIDSNQRISMYIGVKSDLYQLGMVLWALATLEDEPEAHRRPLRLDPEIEVPHWYRNMVENCLSENPRIRLQASTLVTMFPETQQCDDFNSPQIRVEDGFSVQEYLVDSYDQRGRPQIRTVTPRNDWSYFGAGSQSHAESPGLSDDSYYYPPRGRSPPSPLPSNSGCDLPYKARKPVWYGNDDVPSTRSSSSHDPHAPTPRDVHAAEGLAVADRLEEDLRAVSGGDGGLDDEVTPDGSKGISRMPAQGISAPPEIVVDDTEDPPTPRIADASSGVDEPTPAQDMEGQTSGPKATSAREPAETHEPAATKEMAQSKVSEATEHESNSAQRTSTCVQRDIQELGGFPRQADKGPGEDRVSFERVTPTDLDHETREDTETQSDSSPSYTYDRAERKEGRLGGSTLPQNRTQPNMPSELTGIGSGHIVQDGEFRQKICSDEDLGLSSHTATQNVTSKA